MGTSRNLGIDLGTLFYRAACVGDDGVVTVPMDRQQVPPLGHSVILETSTAPNRIIFPSLKQGLNEMYQSPQGVPRQSAMEVFQSLLTAVRRMAGDYVGQEFTGAAISSPASMCSSDRAGIALAAARAGFQRVRIVSDALATAWSYSQQAPREQPLTLLVYSEGYVGADAMVLRHSPRGVHEIAVESDTQQLGGTHLDEALMDSLLLALLHAGVAPEAVRAWLHGLLDLIDGRRSDRSELHAWYQLQRALEQAKELIGDRPSHRFPLPRQSQPAGVHWLEAEIDGQSFAALMRQHNHAAALLVDRVLESTDLTDADIHRVLLVGGTTYQPSVIRAFSQRFGAERVLSQDLQAIAEGCALVAAQLTDEDQPPQNVRLTRSPREDGGRAFLPPPDLLRVVEVRSDTTGESTPLEQVNLKLIHDLLGRGRRREAIAALEQLHEETARLLRIHAGPRQG